MGEIRPKKCEQGKDGKDHLSSWVKPWPLGSALATLPTAPQSLVMYPLKPHLERMLSFSSSLDAHDGTPAIQLGSAAQRNAETCEAARTNR